MEMKLGGEADGPLCTQILGDLGADVIKVEPPTGDTGRRLGLPGPGGFAAIFAHCNRNKRSIALDLKQEAGREAALRLAQRADVLVENYRPGVLERLGLGYEHLARLNPGLVYVAISGFGPDGPYRDLPAYDTVIQGLTGFMPTQAGQGAPPQLVKCIVADKTSALTAVYAVMSGLLVRARTGQGQHIDVPMLDAFAAFMLPDVLGSKTFVPWDKPDIDLSQVHRTWKTADGYIVMMIVEDHQFQGMCRALNREDMIEDPRCTNLMQRILHSEELFRELGDEIAKWPTEELLERARQFGAPVAPANGIEEFLKDPQVRHNHTVFETHDERNGRMRLLRSPVRFAHTPTSHRRNPPGLGEHSEEILREAGLDSKAIARLRETGALASPAGS